MESLQQQVLGSSSVMELLTTALAEDTPAKRARILLRGSGQIAPQFALAHISLWRSSAEQDRPAERVRYQYDCLRPLDEAALKGFFNAPRGTETADRLEQHLGDRQGAATLLQASEFVRPTPWQDTNLYQRVFQPAGLADDIACFWMPRPGYILHAGLCPAEGEQPLTGMQLQDAGALLRCLGPLAEKTLATESRATPDMRLSPRQREVLELALQGDSEHQMAHKLHRSQHTIHTHLQTIYRHFDVCSRAELLAHFIDRPN